MTSLVSAKNGQGENSLEGHMYFMKHNFFNDYSKFRNFLLLFPFRYYLLYLLNSNSSKTTRNNNKIYSLYLNTIITTL